MVKLLLYDHYLDKLYPVFDEDSDIEEEVIIGRFDEDSRFSRIPDIKLLYTEDMHEKTYTSRLHCVLVKWGNDFGVKDISENGTFLNGNEVNRSRDNWDLLKNGDVLRLGFHGLEVIIRR